MKILVICSKNSGTVAPFILEQVESVRQKGVEIVIYTIQGKGVTGYLQNLKYILEEIRFLKPDLIHAHYGLSGLLANLQRKIPVITTFHGSDINTKWVSLFSKITIVLSKHCIFISHGLSRKVNIKNHFSVLPCGVSTDVFFPMEKSDARKILHLPPYEKLVLFASHAGIKVKNFPLAKAAIKLLNDVQLKELKGYDRMEVNILINACDVVLLTSFSEGSPQIIKEAMACNRPIVTTDVGDVKEIIGKTEGCYITSDEPENVAANIKKALEFNQNTNGRERIISLGLSLEQIADKLLEIYKKVIHKNEKKQQKKSR